ncbi:protein ARABIDILLO 1 [Cryptomeria japonica]|uniref:protein ARABIDILLO 1 n=1 Tax=Cryptomeria japonica TaxID=3369 RepID=UPI0025AC9535|nr:protein ARABIDILLO 1 [Cryptomeria japonica]
MGAGGDGAVLQGRGIGGFGSVMALSGGGDHLHEAVALLRSLMRNNEENVVKKAFQPAAMAALLRILACSSCNVQVQENVLGLLWEFSVYEEMNYRIANTIVNDDVLFERLVRFCGCSCSSSVIEFCAAALLQNLCKNEDMRSKVSSTEGIAEGLLYLIESFDMPAQVKALERSENCNSPMVMGWCVSMLDCGFETYQIRGLDLLLGFSQSIVFLQLASHEGAISRLVKLLNSGSTTVLEKAIEALYMLSMPEENEVKIASHDLAIQRLTAFLESDSSSVRGNSVKALESLSFNQINKEKILEQNRALEKVAALLFHESLAAQSSACSLLWNLSNTTTANKIKISSIHGVPQRLSDLLLSNSPLVQEKAAGAIMSLSYNGGSRKMMSSAACIFERLIKLLDSVSTLVHQNAAGALYNLSISPQNIAVIGAHPRSVANLVTLLSSKCGLVQEYVAGALGNLALFEEIREEMKQKGAMPLLKKLKNNSSNISVKTQAKRALDNLMV